jgi:hypothetical protein
MAKDLANGADAEEEGGEFADFMADISQEIAERVASLSPAPSPKAPPVQKRNPTPTPPTDPGVIVDWENIADRMIEEIR